MNRHLHRVRLSADPARLADLDVTAAMENARPELAESGVELTDVETGTSDAVKVAFIIPATMSLDDAVHRVRAALDIGPGGHEELDEMGRIGYIGGRGYVCPRCGGQDGQHFPGCPLRGKSP